MMDTEILMAASAITDFINRCSDMSEAKIVSKETGTMLEKEPASPFSTMFTGRSDLSIITVRFFGEQDHEFVFALFKEMKSRYSEKGFLISMSTGCCLGDNKSDDGGSSIQIILGNA